MPNAAKIRAAGQWRDLKIVQTDEGSIFDYRDSPAMVTRQPPQQALESMYWVNTGITVEDHCYYRLHIDCNFLMGFQGGGFYYNFKIAASTSSANLFYSDFFEASAGWEDYPAAAGRGEHLMTYNGKWVDIPYGSASQFAGSHLFVTLLSKSNQLMYLKNTSLHYYVERWRRRPAAWARVGNQWRPGKTLWLRENGQWKQIAG